MKIPNRLRALGLTAALAAIVTACAVNLGGPRAFDTSAVALRVAPDADPAAVAAALTEVEAHLALITGPADSAWLAAVASRTEFSVSGPATVGDVNMAFLAGEPVGDTTIVLPYQGGALTLHDALYEIDEQRYLDLMVFRLPDAAAARPAVGALLRYMATDVMNSAAVIIAVEVPTGVAGDSVARMLSPAYFDALRCEPGLSAPAERAGIRMFYGPEARVYCEAAEAETRDIGDWVHADLVLGRR